MHRPGMIRNLNEHIVLILRYDNSVTVESEVTALKFFGHLAAP